jgi:2-methylcitrate dehydratase PrpD
MDASHFASALGVAGSFTGGVWAFLADGALTKRFHPGKAAETGVSAAYLAAAGMTGPHHVLDAPWGGFFSTYAPGISEPSLSLAGMGKTFRILRSGIKPYACCRTLHGPIDSLLATISEESAGSEEIERIIVHGNQQTVLQFDRPSPATMFDAQFSMQYCLALAALHGSVNLKHFEPLQSGDPAVARLMARTRIVPDRTLGPTDYPAVELVLADGRRAERQVNCARGHADNPLSEAEVESKARSLMEPALGRDATDEAVELIGRLEQLRDVRQISHLLSAV